MARRISPLWWPVLAVASPVVVPKLLRRNRAFGENRTKAEALNRSRIDEAGGLHFPVTKSRIQGRGIQFQMFLGTGKPPWQRIGDDDLSRAIDRINRAAPKKVLLSAHDTCDHALARLSKELSAETTVLKAGGTYTL